MSSTGASATPDCPPPTLHDRLVRAGRDAGRPWARVEVVDRTDSTNAAALRDPVRDAVLVADTQTAGRGRHGRSWATPAGQALALSVTVPLPAGHPAPGWVPLAAGLAVADAVRALVGDVVALKWPNDVLSADTGRKLCGILAQVARVPGVGGFGAGGVGGGAFGAGGFGSFGGGGVGSFGGGGSDADGLVVVGVGLNVALTELPVPTATSLHLLADAAGVPAPGRDDVAVAVADALSARHATWAAGGPALDALRREYRDRCTTIGADVLVHLGAGDASAAGGAGGASGVGGGGEGADPVVAGRAVEVDDDGRLVVDVPGTGRRAFSAGDVEHVRRPGQVPR